MINQERKGDMNILNPVGYRTFIPLAVLGLKKLLETAGVQIEDAQLSTFVDATLTLLAAIFATLKQRRLNSCEK